MVRIVNGQIVDDEPLNQQSGGSSSSGAAGRHRQLFPSTNRFFGKFSDSVSFMGFESEIFWLVILFCFGFFFGGKSMAVLALCLALLQRNIGILKSKESRFGSIHRQ